LLGECRFQTTTARAIALTAAAAALSVVAAAPAAAEWTAPLTVSHPHTAAWVNRPVFTSNGATVVSWRWQDGLGNGSTVGSSMATSPAAEAPFETQRALPAGTLAGPQAYAAARLVVATQTGTGSTATLSVRFGDVKGRFGLPRRIARAQNLRGAQLDVNARGDAVLGWWVDDGVKNDRVYVSLRPHGGSFGPAMRLAVGRIRGLAVAIGARGDVLAAWDALGVVRTRFKGRSVRTFGAVDELRSHPAFNAALQTAVTPAGRAWVAWTAQLLSEGGDRGDVFVEVATRPQRAHRLQPAVLLQRAPRSATAAPVSLAAGPSGAVILAWSMWDDWLAAQPGFTEIRAATIHAAGPPQITTLARFASVELRDSAVAAAAHNGDTTVLWTQSTEVMTDANRVLVSVRPSSADWSSPDLVYQGRGAAGTVAYPPGASQPIVVFGDRVAATPLSSRVIRVTTRR